MCGLCHGAGMARKCYADLNAAVYFYLQTKQSYYSKTCNVGAGEKATTLHMIQLSWCMRKDEARTQSAGRMDLFNNKINKNCLEGEKQAGRQ